MIDHDGYRHIVDAIVAAATQDYESCLALRPVCKAFKLQADAALGRHIQLVRLDAPSPETALEGNALQPSSNGDRLGRDAGHDEENGDPSVTQWSSAVRTSTFALGRDVTSASIDPDLGHLVVQTSTGHPVPLLYPSSLPPAGGRWPGLGRALASMRIVDLSTHLQRGERSALFPALRRVDTLRFVRVNDAEFSLGALACRRYVGMVVLGLPPTYPSWDTFFPRGTLPTIKSKLVLNVVLPQRTEVPDHILQSPWQGAEPKGDWDMVFIFRPIDTVLAYHTPDIPIDPPSPDLGVLLNVFIHVLDIATRRTYTLVGLEEVEWIRLGVRSPPAGPKEKYFRAALEELIVPVLGLEKAMVNIDEIQSRIAFVTHQQYREGAGRDEYDTDLLTADALFLSSDMEDVRQGIVGPDLA